MHCHDPIISRLSDFVRHAVPVQPMTRQWDILIIGAGIVGVCSAWYLTQTGYRPPVIDRGEVAGGSSHANAGLMVPSSWLPMAADNGIEQLLEKWQDPEASIYLPAAGGPHLSDWRRLLRAAAEPVQWLKTTAALHGLVGRSLERYREMPLPVLSSS